MIWCAVGCLASTLATEAGAQGGGILYGIEGFQTLVEIDLENEEIVEVGEIGFGVNALAFHPPTGELFGIGLVDDDRQLVRISRTTGAGSVVGPIGFDSASDIAYNPSNGGFYSTVRVGQTGGGASALIQIDAQTGNGEVIGETGFQGFLGLAYDAQADSLFGIAALVEDPSIIELVIVDSATGTSTANGSVDFTPEGFPTGLTHDPFSDQLNGVHG